VSWKKEGSRIVIVWVVRKRWPLPEEKKGKGKGGRKKHMGKSSAHGESAPVYELLKSQQKSEGRRSVLSVVETAVCRCLSGKAGGKRELSRGGEGGGAAI